MAVFNVNFSFSKKKEEIDFSLAMPFEYIDYRKKKIEDNVWKKYNKLFKKKWKT
tara:strand:- start:22435 stop:22596 length:162 start_codon:yes stop_codon:yes gene_type:complete